MKNKKAWAIAVVAGILAPLAIWAASQQFLSPSAAINCESGGGCNITINGGTVNNPANDQVYGSGVDDTTIYTAVSTTQDVGVGRNLYVVSGLTVAGTLGITGTTTLSGDVSGVPKSTVITMTSATNTPCAIQNTSGVTRTVLATGLLYTGGSNAGSVGQLAVGTSTGPTVTSTSPFINTILTKVASVDVITTTSTQEGTGGVYAPWKTTEWLVFNTGGTSTQSGTCRVLYY